MWVVETPGDDGIKVILFLFNLTTWGKVLLSLKKKKNNNQGFEITVVKGCQNESGLFPALKDFSWPLSHLADWRVWKKQLSILTASFLSFLWDLWACREHVSLVALFLVGSLKEPALYLEEASGCSVLLVNGGEGLSQQQALCKPTWLADLKHILHYWLHQGDCLSTNHLPWSSVYLPADCGAWVKKEDSRSTLWKYQTVWCSGYLEERKARCPVCLPSLRILPIPPRDPPSCPRVPSTSKLHSLNGVVADQVHSVAPGAAPDTDAATGVDGTAQPIGRCPHHLRREDKGKGGCEKDLGLEGSCTCSVQGGCISWGFPGGGISQKWEDGGIWYY